MEVLSDLVVKEVVHMMNIHSYKGRKVTIEKRQWFGLSFCEEGQITYTHKGKTYVSDPDHAVILPKGQSYSLHCEKKGVFPVINFLCEGSPRDTFLVIPIKNADVYIREFKKMQELSVFEGNRHEILSIFYHMLHRLCGTDTRQSILTPALRYIENHYCDSGLSNGDLAKQCNISEVYFRKLFAKQYQTTPKQFILDLRINKAKQLLGEGNLKMMVVAEQCGFANPYHFSRAFRQKEGMTPMAYMKQNKVYTI